MLPSPDGRWVAFKELHKLYVAPLPQAGKLLKLSATETLVPVKTLSNASGDWLAWSRDSRSVQWTAGENFFEQSLENVMRPLAKDEKAPEPRAVKIGFEFEKKEAKEGAAKTAAAKSAAKAAPAGSDEAANEAPAKKAAAKSAAAKKAPAKKAAAKTTAAKTAARKTGS